VCSQRRPIGTQLKSLQLLTLYSSINTLTLMPRTVYASSVKNIPAIRVGRGSDGAVEDFGFDGGGDLDVEAVES